jgi:hypothetical protein
MKKFIRFWITNAESVLAGHSEPYLSLETKLELGAPIAGYYADQGYIHFHDMELEIPDVNIDGLHEKTIAALKLHLTDIRAKAQLAVQDVETRINDLLMIGFSPAAEAIPGISSTLREDEVEDAAMHDLDSLDNDDTH